MEINEEIREFLKEQVQLAKDIIEDLLDYEPDEPVYAVYQYFPEIDAIGIGDYWYVNEPYVDEDMESTRLLMEHYEELEYLKEECKVQMTLLELNIAHTKQLEQIVEIIEENELELD